MKVGADGYDLGGTVIADFEYDSYMYSSFCVDINGTFTPVSAVTVKP